MVVEELRLASAFSFHEAHCGGPRAILVELDLVDLTAVLEKMLDFIDRRLRVILLE